MVAAGIAMLGILSLLVVARIADDWRFTAGLGAGFTILAGAALAASRWGVRRHDDRTLDRALARAALDATGDPAALTARDGAIVAANAAWLARFGAALPEGGEAAALAARRDGTATLTLASGAVLAACVGGCEDHLLWRVRETGGDAVVEAGRAIDALGARFGESGVMLLLVDATGRILAANRVFAARATGRDGDVVGQDFAALLTQDEAGALRFGREATEEGGQDDLRLRLLHVPVAGDDVAGAAMVLLFDEPVGDGASDAHPSDVHDLLHMLPLGLALVDRDGRFLFVNDAFARIAQVGPSERPVYPGDLVVKEDKGAVADAVRRFAAARPPAGPAGQAPILSGDVAVRLARRPEEPVSLTVASVRGMGPATVLLSLKDSSEEIRLKRQVNQANKMQAVGQLAGGIAHDFNNILTALIGHCDLMLMRHTPGDSDYDDIQQIRHNANRAAGLTRQLLAFSRQQTLRPQVVQLPDIVSEVSNLLKRLLGDATRLEINHGRALGPVRADPGQLEQVIVNLAVNARDAMPGGGTITIRTFGVAAAEVRHLGSDILPAGDYTAIAVSDTGTGIAPADLPKIFEPFFTTKEVGKGTGLGLSTVYGIVKQSGGFIFADSELGRGTSFVIYLPVFHGETAIETAERPKPAPALWGSGRILLVEDEDMVRSVAERALSRQGYQVSTASNGEEALELLAQVEREGEGFDLLVSDVMMPLMDGPTMVAEARRRFPTLPVLFMSGYAEEQLRRSIDLPDVAFLAKPFSVQQLAEAARDALAAAGPAPEA
ncbi:ATP-binding protein [Sphingomonas sp.]|uniref:hybrid sensor histidine kinase/response regulator n=1 Tax=Sphingomonas sp. TaxID=28214 RepID=UPI003B00D93F